MLKDWKNIHSLHRKRFPWIFKSTCLLLTFHVSLNWYRTDPELQRRGSWSDMEQFKGQPRLPKFAYPKRYDIRLKPDLAACKFTGSVAIDLEILEATKFIVLNAAELSVNHDAVSFTYGCSSQVTISDPVHWLCWSENRFCSDSFYWMVTRFLSHATLICLWKMRYWCWRLEMRLRLGLECWPLNLMELSMINWRGSTEGSSLRSMRLSKYLYLELFFWAADSFCFYKKNHGKCPCSMNLNYTAFRKLIRSIVVNLMNLDRALIFVYKTPSLPRIVH